MYYYMENVGRCVYKDMIEVPKVVVTKRKKSTSSPRQVAPDHTSSSSSAPSRSSGSLLSTDAKV